MKFRVLLLLCFLSFSFVSLAFGKGKKGKSGSKERRYYGGRSSGGCDESGSRSKGKSKSRSRERCQERKTSEEEPSREEYTGDSCTQSVAVGFGESRLTRWYFEQHANQCLRFEYSGKGGNQNNFGTKEACETKCARKLEITNPCANGQPYRDPATLAVKFCNANIPTDCPSQYYCHTGVEVKTTACCPGDDDPCTLPLVEGQGSTIVLRWYFDLNTGICQQFIYKGLKGNVNNFMSQSDCQRICPQPKSTTTPTTSAASASTTTTTESTTSTTTSIQFTSAPTTFTTPITSVSSDSTTSSTITYTPFKKERISSTSTNTPPATESTTFTTASTRSTPETSTSSSTTTSTLSSKETTQWEIEWTTGIDSSTPEPFPSPPPPPPPPIAFTTASTSVSTESTTSSTAITSSTTESTAVSTTASTLSTQETSTHSSTTTSILSSKETTQWENEWTTGIDSSTPEPFPAPPPPPPFFDTIS